MRGNPARERVARLVERFDAENDCADARVARSLLGVSGLLDSAEIFPATVPDIFILRRLDDPAAPSGAGGPATATAPATALTGHDLVSHDVPGHAAQDFLPERTSDDLSAGEELV